MSSLAGCQPRALEVAGSNPAGPTISICFCGCKISVATIKLSCYKLPNIQETRIELRIGFLKKLKESTEKAIDKGVDIEKKGIEKGAEVGTKAYDDAKEAAQKGRDKARENSDK